MTLDTTEARRLAETWLTDEGALEASVEEMRQVASALLDACERLGEVERTVQRFVDYAAEYPEDIRGPLRDDFLPQLRALTSPQTPEQGG